MNSTLTALIISWIQVIVPQPCYDEIFIDYNYLNRECLAIVLSKCLGYAIILASLLVKIPQILKIFNAKNADGMSIIGTSFELFAITGTLAYSFANNFPFSSYGEAFFVGLQTLLIAYMILCYTVGHGIAEAYVVLYLGIVIFLLSPYIPMVWLWYMQTSVIFLIIIGRLIQATTNYYQKGTGQLSLITTVLLMLGAIARIFTSIQETGDWTAVASYIAGSSSNAILLSQIIHYNYLVGDKKKIE